VFAVSELADGQKAVVDAVGGTEWEVQPIPFTQQERFPFSSPELLQIFPAASKTFSAAVVLTNPLFCVGSII
jgi:hypothetical protein